MYARLLGIGALYGFGFMLVKSFFPTPIALFMLSEGPSSEGNLTLLASVYLASGLLAGVISGPLFGTFLLWRRGSRADAAESHPALRGGADLWRALVLSFVLAMVIGLISGLLILAAYWFGVLSRGGVLDPLTIIGGANHPPGYPLLVVWSLARDLLPAMLTGFLLAPFGGGFLYRVYASRRPPKDTVRSRRIEDDF